MSPHFLSLPITVHMEIMVVLLVLAASVSVGMASSGQDTVVAQLTDELLALSRRVEQIEARGTIPTFRIKNVGF